MKVVEALVHSTSRPASGTEPGDGAGVAGSTGTGGLVVVSPAPRAAWTALLAADEHAVADQSPAWIDALCAGGRYLDASRLYRLADGREFVLPLVGRAGHLAGAVPARLPRRWWSPPPAWGFGGLVGPGLDAGVVAAVLVDLQAQGALRISLRPDPLRAEAWAAAGGPGIVRVPRLAHVVDLRDGHDGVDRAITKSARRGVRLAERAGVTVRTEHSGALLGVHYDLYLTSVRRWARRQHEPASLALWRARSRDPLGKLEAIARQLGDRFCHHVAYHEGRPVASAICVVGRSAHDTRGAMDRELAHPVRANDLLQAHALHHAVDHGCRHYHLGESGGSSSLAQFKEKFGARAVPYHEIRLERLPLTAADTLVRAAVKRAIGFRDA